MSQNAFIDIAIGLVLLYLVLSIFCTVLNELIASALGLRAKDLATGIQKLLDDPTIRADFYNHGLIDGTKNVSVSGAAAAKDHPSYLSGKTFALALLGSLDVTKPIPAYADIESAVRNLPDSNIRDTLLAHLATAWQSVTELRDGVATWFDQSMD